MFPGPGDTGSAPGEEFVDTGTPGIAEVMRHLTTDVPLPDSETFAPLLARYPASETVLTQHSVLGQEVECYARCRWGLWLRAHAPPTPRGPQRPPDAAVWRYTTASDGSGEVAPLTGTTAAAAAGDAARVRREYRANCV